MKCEKQSEKRQATGIQLLRMQLCQWQIIFWPLSLSLYGWRFATVTACFLFSCTFQFCDSWRPSSKMLRCSSVWKTAWLFVLLFLPHPLCTFVVYISVSATFSLFLYRFLLSHFSSFSSSSSFVLSLCFSLFLSSLFTSDILQRLCLGPNQHFCSGWCPRSKVQRHAWGELLSHTTTAMNTYTDKAATSGAEKWSQFLKWPLEQVNPLKTLIAKSPTL